MPSRITPRALAGLVSSGLAIALPAAAIAQPACTVDTFDNATSQGGWRFTAGATSFVPSGGNPGWQIFNVADTTIPILRTGVVAGTNPFTGNFRARRVISMAADVQVVNTDFGCCDAPGAIVLINDNNTPSGNDDWGAYLLSPQSIPPGPSPWTRLTFDIPSESATLPAGWDFIQFGPGAPPPNWNTLIQDVDAVAVCFGDPSLFYIFQFWRVGVDNVEICTEGQCYANCDGSTGVPTLTPADFVCFLNRFRAGEAYANCDGSTGVPTLTPADFVCFLSRFRQGC